MKRAFSASVQLVVGSLITVGAAASDPPMRAQQWPQWRGPLGTGVAPQGDPPTEWSETKNVRWKTAIPGHGNASPIVWGDKVYVLTAVKTDRTGARGGGTSGEPAPQETEIAAIGHRPEGAEAAGKQAASASQEQEREERRRPPRGEREGGGPGGDRQGGPPREGGRGRGMRGESPKNAYEFHVIALDRKDGKILWDRKVNECVPHEGTHPDGSFASASPVTDGEFVYASFGSYGLYCLDMKGEVVWKKDLGDMRTRNSFGEGASPALHGETLVVTWDHEENDDFTAAFDKRTGKELWRQKRDEPTTWSTPLIVESGGKAQVITAGTNRIRSYDLSNGEIVWECAGLTQNVIPTPVYDDGIVYLMSGFRGASLKAIRLSEAKGDISESAALLWKFEKDTPYVPSPLLYEGALYFFENNRAVMTSLSAMDGAVRYGPHRLEGLRMIYASPVAASGRVYVVDRDGKMLVMDKGAEPKILASNALEDSFDASPAIAGKELFLRGHKSVYCIAE